MLVIQSPIIKNMTTWKKTTRVEAVMSKPRKESMIPARQSIIIFSLPRQAIHFPEGNTINGKQVPFSAILSGIYSHSDQWPRHGGCLFLSVTVTLEQLVLQIWDKTQCSMKNSLHYGQILAHLRQFSSDQSQFMVSGIF